jgi:flavin-dependent dehydrogenase
MRNPKGSSVPQNGETRDHKTDVVVIGGGPAGLAAAIALRRKGLGVTVADGAAPPVDKPCGEGLLPDALAALTQLGITVPQSEGHALAGIRFVSPRGELAAHFPGSLGFGIRRKVLHQHLIDAAGASGVELLWRSPVSAIREGGAIVAGKLLSARWIVGADGIRSRVRGWCGLAPRGRLSARYAFRQHYRIMPWSNFMEVHWGRNAQAYVTPVAQDEVCVVLVSNEEQMHLKHLAVECPKLAERLGSAITVGAERGAVTVGLQLDKVYRGRVALVGDASGSVDAITGEGLSLSFHQAIALAEAIFEQDLGSYQLAHHRLARKPTLMSRAMLALDGNVWLQDRVMRALAGDPNLFERLLSFHVGATCSASSASVGAHLFWRLALA